MLPLVWVNVRGRYAQRGFRSVGGLRFLQTMVAMVASLFFFFSNRREVEDPCCPHCCAHGGRRALWGGFNIEKECLRLCSVNNKKKKRREMRVENGSGAVCCVQGRKRLNFPAGNLSAFIHFTPSKAENGEKGTVCTPPSWSGSLPLSRSCAITFFL